MEWKPFIGFGMIMLPGGLCWYFGTSQKTAEENEGVGFVEPELKSFYDKSIIFGKALFYIGVILILSRVIRLAFAF